MFDLIAFDADDTLWENEAYYQEGRKTFHTILKPYGIPTDLDARLDGIETRNIPHFGYGVNGFVFSLIETAIQVTDEKINAADIQQIINIAHQMLEQKVDLFDHVEPMLSALSRSYPLMLITKGDLLHQQKKLERSGLSQYFSYVEVVADKTREIYAAILAKHKVDPSRFLMIGNSMRSDILPVLEMNAHAVYIPSRLMWMHEHCDLPKELAAKFVELEHLGQVVDWIKSSNM
ncbi:MAG: HAD family hydrolase [Leptolinea sp.]|jgi:putative hydrolase of the HAD superfamily|nr:HAD family hydrolase [Leptolinea sp.]